MHKGEPEYKLVFIASLAGVLIISTLLKVLFTSAKELWLDEAYSGFLVSNSFAEMMTYVRGDVHPPLYYVFLKTWTLLFGLAPFSLQSFSIVASIVASILFFCFVRKLISSPILQFVCFTAFQFSPVLFWYSVEVRMYMFAIIFIVLSLIYFHGLITAISYNKGDVLLFSVFSACAFYTHYCSVFLLLGYAAYLSFLVRKKQVQVKTLVISSMLVLLITLPWFPTAYQQRVDRMKVDNDLQAARLDPSTLSYGFHEGKGSSFLVDAVHASENIASILGVYPASNKTLAILLSLPFVIVICYSVFLFFIKDRLIMLVFIMTGTYWAAGMLLHMSSRRYFIFLTPFLIVMIGVSLQHMWKKPYVRHASMVAAFCVVILSILGTIRIYSNDYCKPTTEIVKCIRNNYQPNDIIVFDNLYYQVPFDYYANQLRFSSQRRGFPVSIYDWWNKQPFKGWGGPVITQSDLINFFEGLKQERSMGSIWLVLFETSYYDPFNRLLSASREASNNIRRIDIDFGECTDKIECGSRYRLYKMGVN